MYIELGYHPSYEEKVLPSVLEEPYDWQTPIASKWVEVALLKKTKGDNIVYFLSKHIITRFGIPKVLISDNGPQFEGSVLAEFFEKYGMKRRFSPVYYHQANGQVEVMNCIIFSGLKKNMVHIRGNIGAWTEELPTVLWSLRTTPSHATGESPFALVYGTKVVLPVEVGLPSYRQRGDQSGWTTKVVGPATYELLHVNGEPINHTWHATKLRKYYV
ncbi:hypothetical protein LIER_35850 [Lithospermum erythrorhizon]|uniref:Integrase catalytic domain-containing protein n=1 Tax=Lithospermum erythrorhizon TaxID=34254 RepID=A0AAV3NY19_LITER